MSPQALQGHALSIVGLETTTLRKHIYINKQTNTLLPELKFKGNFKSIKLSNELFPLNYNYSEQQKSNFIETNHFSADEKRAITMFSIFVVKRLLSNRPPNVITA